MQLHTKGEPYPSIEREGSLVFASLEEAVNEYARQGLHATVDEGIMIRTDTITYSPYQKPTPVSHHEALYIW